MARGLCVGVTVAVDDDVDAAGEAADAVVAEEEGLLLSLSSRSKEGEEKKVVT